MLIISCWLKASSYDVYIAISSNLDATSFSNLIPPSRAAPSCFPTNIYLIKVNNRNTRERCDDVVLVFLLLTLNIF